MDMHSYKTAWHCRTEHKCTQHTTYRSYSKNISFDYCFESVYNKFITSFILLISFESVRNICNLQKHFQSQEELTTGLLTTSSALVRPRILEPGIAINFYADDK